MATAKSGTAEKEAEPPPELATVSGIAAGAAVGSLLGPLGAAVGAMVGGVAGRDVGKRTIRSQTASARSDRKEAAGKVKGVGTGTRSSSEKAITPAKKSPSRAAKKATKRKK